MVRFGFLPNGWHGSDCSRASLPDRWFTTPQNCRSAISDGNQSGDNRRNKRTNPTCHDRPSVNGDYAGDLARSLGPCTVVGYSCRRQPVKQINATTTLATTQRNWENAATMAANAWGTEQRLQSCLPKQTQIPETTGETNTRRTNSHTNESGSTNATTAPTDVGDL
jgi:hypothetical protein